MSSSYRCYSTDIVPILNNSKNMQIFMIYKSILKCWIHVPFGKEELDKLNRFCADIRDEDRKA